MSSLPQGIAISLSRMDGWSCRVRGCRGQRRKGYVGHLCRRHERRQRTYGHPEAVPLRAGEVRYWRIRARRLLKQVSDKPQVIEALRVCNAVLEHGDQCFEEESLRAAISSLQMNPQTFLELTVGLGLRYWSRDLAPMQDGQQWHEVLKWTLRLGKAGEKGRRLGTRARREFTGVLNKRLGLFVLRCMERWKRGKDLEDHLEETLGTSF